jgi:predicted nuclease with TOPRIM domain
MRRDILLLTFIRKERDKISSRGVFGKSSQLHAIYREAEHRLRELVEKQIGKFDYEKLKDENMKLQASLDKKTQYIIKLRERIGDLKKEPHKEQIAGVKEVAGAAPAEQSKVDYQILLKVNDHLKRTYFEKSHLKDAITINEGQLERLSKRIAELTETNRQTAAKGRSPS